MEVWSGLTRFELKLLEALEAKAGETVSREDIEKALYPAEGATQAGSSNGIEVFIRRIRVKMGDLVTITTVRGRGYRLEKALGMLEKAPEVTNGQ